MSHQVLARKWRPASFREMVGQEHVLQALINALDRDRLHHAYLFTGTRGVGKTTIARIFARCLNCEQGVTSTPCGECSACREISEGRFIDLIEVDAASRTKVEDTRELLENVQYAPTRGRFKVYLIDEVHMLSTHSFNALLKTLEEPPPHVKFLLATTDPQKLPATILSRCLQFSLKNMPAERIVAHLQHVLGGEGIACDEPALWLLAEAAQGSMRDALSLTDQAIGFGAGSLTEADVRSMLGTIDRQAVQGLLQAIIDGDGPGLFAQIEQLAGMGTDFQSLLDELIRLLHAVAVAQAVPGAIPERQADTRGIGDFAAALSGEDVQIFYQMALNGRRDLPYVPDPRRGFEMTALRLLTFRPVLAGEEGAGPVPEPAAAAREGAGKKPEAAGGAAADTGEADPGPAVAQLVGSRPGSPQPAGHRPASPRDALVEAPVPAAGPTVAVSTGGGGPAAATGELPGLAELAPGDWNRLFGQLEIPGVARNIAANAVLESVVGTTLSFVLDSAQAAMVTDEHRERLAAALEKHFGSALEVRVRQAENPGETPALYRRRLRAERQRAAVVELEEDENVRLLCVEFGGRLEKESVQPID